MTAQSPEPVEIPGRPPVPKFDAAVGNPPYGRTIPGNRRILTSYHDSVGVAQGVARRVSLVYPARWLTRDGFAEGFPEFVERELSSPHYSTFEVFREGELFEGVITGTVNIGAWDTAKLEGPVLFTHLGKSQLRPNLGNGGALIPGEELAQIFTKVATVEGMDSLVAPLRYYGLETRSRDKVEALSRKPGSPRLICHGSQGDYSVPAYAIKRPTGDWKVFMSKTFNKRQGYGLARAGRIFLGAPGTLATASFLKIGSFKTKREARNCLLYLKTTFASVWIGAITSSHNGRNKNFSLVPLLDFKSGEILDRPGTFLDFSKPKTLDDQLAEIYGITDEERRIMGMDLHPWRDKLSLTADR